MKLQLLQPACVRGGILEWNNKTTNLVLDLQKQFVSKFSNSQERYEDAGISKHNWHRLGTVSKDTKTRIFRFLMRPEFELSPSALDVYGEYERNDIVPMLGLYRLYRPNSEFTDKIEIFSAQLEWSLDDWCGAITVQDHKRTTVHQLYKPQGSIDSFFRASRAEGWNSLYVIGRLAPFEISDSVWVNVMMGVSLATDTLPDGEGILRPILFPIVMEQQSDMVELAAYRNVRLGDEEHSHADRLLRAAAYGRDKVLDVWRRYQVPGSSNGGPSQPSGK